MPSVFYIDMTDAVYVYCEGCSYANPISSEQLGDSVVCDSCSLTFAAVKERYSTDSDEDLSISEFSYSILGSWVSVHKPESWDKSLKTEGITELAGKSCVIPYVQDDFVASVMSHYEGYVPECVVADFSGDGFIVFNDMDRQDRKIRVSF